MKNNRVSHPLVLLVVCFLALLPREGRAEGREVAGLAPSFKVLAFYNGTWDAAHIDFVREANLWFPQLAAQNGFSYTATNNWNQLNTTTLAQY